MRTLRNRKQRANKALHPTAYSFVPYARASLRSLRFRRRVSLIVRRLARSFDAIYGKIALEDEHGTNILI